MRTFRGVPHLEQPGICLTKDVVYQRGLRQIEQAVATDEHVLERLMVGKIALEDIPVREELGIALFAQSLYQLALQPDLDSYILSFEQQRPAKEA